MVEEKQEGGIFPPPPGKIGLTGPSEGLKSHWIKIFIFSSSWDLMTTKRCCFSVIYKQSNN